jgi:hypothetical protein
LLGIFLVVYASTSYRSIATQSAMIYKKAGTLALPLANHSEARQRHDCDQFKAD